MDAHPRGGYCHHRHHLGVHLQREHYMGGHFGPMDYEFLDEL